MERGLRQPIRHAATETADLAIDAAADLLDALRDADHEAPAAIVARLIHDLHIPFVAVYRRVDDELLLEAAAGQTAAFLPRSVQVDDWDELREAFGSADPAEDARRDCDAGRGVLMAIRDEWTAYGVLALAAPTMGR